MLKPLARQEEAGGTKNGRAASRRNDKQDMTRCFIAIDLPDRVKDHLQELQPTSLPKIRPVARQQTHLTLHFLGELDDQTFEQTRLILLKVQALEFEFRLSGLGQFPPQGQPRVFWVGVEPNPQLRALHRAIGELLTDETGYVPEARPFSPHITLARFNGPTSIPVLNQFVKQNQEYRSDPIRVTEFTLYSSAVINRAPKYAKEVVISLRRTADH